MTVGEPYDKGVQKKASTNYGKQVPVHTINKTGERYPLSIIEFSNADRRNKKHPTQKPVALMEYLIKTYTNEGDIVLDNTMGSGTTCVAAVNTGRRYLGIELDENYYDIAVKRVDEAIKNKEESE